MTTRTESHGPDTESARRIGRWLVEAALLAAVLSAVFAGIQGNWDGVVRFVVIGAIMLAARNADVPPQFAAPFMLFLLLATWASVQHWYRSIEHFDVLVHFLTPGSTAAALYFVLADWRFFPAVREPIRGLQPSSPVVWVAFTGLTAAVLWEFYEWVAEQFMPKSIIVGYGDTLLDLLAGLLGSVVFGVLVRWWGQRVTADR